MLYIIILTAIAISILCFYILFNLKENTNDNIMDDIPSLNVSKDELEKHAMEISEYSFTVGKTNCKRRLIKSLDISYKTILKDYGYIDKQVRKKIEVIQASEWLLDNLYLIEKEYCDIKLNMPEAYYKNLPIINKGFMKGYPRIYHIAVEMISHTNGRIDEEIIETFINAYQRNTVLTSGELWALPIMLRIALIQNISGITQKIVFAQKEMIKGDEIAEGIICAFNSNTLDEEINKIISQDIEVSSHLIERLIKVLRDNGIESPQIYKWIDEKLDSVETNANKIVMEEHKRQSSYGISIGNSITGIREVEALNWRESFEKLSVVEKILRKDPSGIYSSMDFQSRDYYRHIVENISKRVRLPESLICKKALECCREISEKDNYKEYEKHIGYYLIDEGIDCLEKKIGFKNKGIVNLLDLSINKRIKFYLGTIIFGTLILTTFIVWGNLYNDPQRILWKYILGGLVLLIPCSEIVVSTFNWSINRITEPRFISKIELKNEIPEEYSSIVVIPTLLGTEEKIKNLIDDMEVYYLSNNSKNIYFALLGDFKDSNMENEAKDEVLLNTALKLIKTLNNKYAEGGKDIFYFFNRYRQFNECEGIWMGWERKRGKLMEFNSLIRGDKNTSYNTISGDVSNLSKVKYVITLDADTQLPRDTARKLIGAMCHVLNKPYIDKDKKIIIRGHGLMQPRVSVGIESANKTMFSRIFSGEIGMDLYTNAVSDVYEDLFDEGIFTGKGIYDIDVFDLMLKDEIPENTVLSHDLLEGSYVRAALATDVELIDGYPAYYNASCKRLHRWVRGDWQLIPWLFKKNKVNTLSKWKIFDNLRRSLLAPSIITLVITSLIIFDNPDTWLLVAFLSLLCPILFDVSENVVAPMRGIGLSGKINNGKDVVEQVFLIFCFLPYQAYLMLDAIVRTLYRVFFSKKNLLEWQTAADAEASSGRKLVDFWSSMWVGSFLSVIIAIAAFQNSEQSVILMIPSVIIWFLSPWIAYSISRETLIKKGSITKEQEDTLRRLTRKTWAYFEDLVAPENNWLAPDNYQEEPPNGVAPRTSPTNMGMGITSNLVAFDFGYIGMIELTERIENILDNMESLEMYRGHFYNWYDTKTKEPLHPRYVSTVDSGNLVGYFWLTQQCISEYLDLSIVDKRLTKGLIDTLNVAQEEIKTKANIEDFYVESIHNIKNVNLDIIHWKNILLDLWDTLISLDKKEDTKNLYWNKKLKHMVDRYLKEIEYFLPWIELSLDGDKDDLKQTLLDSINGVCLKNLNKYIEHIKENTNNLEFIELLDISINNIKSLIEKVEKLEKRLGRLADNTEFKMLYDEKRQLFTIGYDKEKDSIGKCYYDLLASEARQASFVAIAKGDIKQEHWFKLGRSMTLMGKSKGLVSWSGTMFEYFMPLLIMKSYPNTILDETYRAVIEGQKKYGMDKKVPWGISESAFYNFDPALNYQYKAFGIPGLGLKRGLANELVIAPYASVMALQIDLKSSMNNIKRLIEIGMEGNYGLYEAADYTKDRISKETDKELIKCFMVHHQGMSLMALDNVLNNKILQRRFHNIPRVKATELVLQEKMPKIVIYDRQQKYDNIDVKLDHGDIVGRKYDTANTDMPQTHIMSNGTYSLMITNSGIGYSKKDDMTIYRWREDSTVANKGMFFYIKNINSNEYWSSCYEPCKCEGEEYEVSFSLDKAEFKRKDGSLRTHTEIIVSSEDDAEIRKISITNTGEHARTVEITSYGEVTLAPYMADLVHPAFGNLFIKTEYIDNPGAIIAYRRPRAKGSKEPWMMQTVAAEGKIEGCIQYETSRANFIGRCRNLVSPKAMDNEAQLKMTVGAVLDPIISMRVRVRVEKGETFKVAYTTGVTDSREKAVNLAQKYSDMHNVDRIFDLSWTEAQLNMKYLGIKSPQANMYQLMASKILFLSNSFKDREAYIKNIKKSQSSLWAYGISGDLPIVLLIIKEESEIDIVRQMLNAHHYWSINGLRVDFVILNMQTTSYDQPVLDAARDLINSSNARDKQNKAGGIFLHSKATMDSEDIDLLMGISRIVIYGDTPLIEQLKDDVEELQEEKLEMKNTKHTIASKSFQLQKLNYFNGIGGFDEETNSYIILLKNHENTPAPWINVVSNGKFGFHVSENGVSYSWNKNSRENKLTVWSNDPVTDGEAELFYIRDEVTGDLWSISPKPIRDEGEYLIEHGFGYSTFKHECFGIMGEMTMFVDMNENLKICKIKLKNNTKDKRVLSTTYYAPLVLGVTHEQSAQYIYTDFDEDKKFIFARNAYSEHFGNLICYMKSLGGDEVSFTGDRKNFVGKGLTLKQPKGLSLKKLPNTVGAGIDPCLAENTKITLNPNEERQIIFMFGQEESFDKIKAVINEYEDNTEEKVEKELNNAKKYWENTVSTIQVETPDKSMDILLNGWLMYQIISCRFWARTAFYQSGGAYGFRDQLQDVMAISYVDSQTTRNHIIYTASKQYIEGDVQHWWHPVVESGIRTRFSDDLLWLPYVTADYIKNTGDYSILDEEAGYLSDEPLKEGEDERYNISKISDEKGSIYEHCLKAIDIGLKFGEHNIPLMGSGDWNDGMSTIGNKGKGESVWLGWFLYSILDEFIPICKLKADKEREENYIKMKEFIRENLEKNAWDGGWYRRAYFDDGTPLGSMKNDECKIDSLSQSWSVISKAAKPSRAKEAMEALERNLIMENKDIVMLLTPAFDKSSLEPGYIKGYVPGVRENGGQYTHASIWVILALAKMGSNNKAWKIFNMINPINHSSSHLSCETYKVEPYVMTADVYAVEPHIGRGGWSWYTGAAGWMYRTGIEGILGLSFKGEKGFTISPCVPDNWKAYKMHYNRGNCKYNIDVKRGEEKGIWINEKKLEDKIIPFMEDGVYEVKVII